MVRARKALEAILSRDRRSNLEWPGKFGMVGASKVMEEVWDLLEKVLDIDIPVLITGESGTGKELVAKALHAYGKRKDGPFVVSNCAAIPESLLESELFGHVKGAFTGAIYSKPGRFEEAHKGTIFLDEIGEMSPNMQGKLLRVLENGEVRRVGSNEAKRIDVRVVAATNKDLEQEVIKGSFRKDLFYRINVFHIHLPPLRERGEDAVILANHFLHRFLQERSGGKVTLSGEAKKRILNYHWPGNVRELENSIRRALAICKGNEIGPEDLGIE